MLAGGESLHPIMDLGFAQPPLLVDNGRVAALDRLDRENGHLVTGALPRHRTLEWSALVREAQPPAWPCVPHESAGKHRAWTVRIDSARRKKMPWVKTDPAMQGLDHILEAHTLNADSVRAHILLYRAIMFGKSGLSRSEREALAVCVSTVNDCHY